VNETEVFVRVFGGMGIDAGGEPVSIGGLRQRRLLALLAIRAGSVVSLDWLVEHLWDDKDRPAAPIPALRTYLSRLRNVLPEGAQGWIETESLGYRFAAPTFQIDYMRFNELRDRARYSRESLDPLAASSLLDEALTLWRGDPFRELEDLDWARGAIEQLHLDRLELLEERWEVALAQGRHTQITGELAAFTAEHGLRDRAARQYALALHRSGRTTEALRVVSDHRRTLAEQSGLEPSAGVIELERALLAGDPALDVEIAGRPLRGYQLLDEIGTGAFAIVWRAVQPSVDREVAIKQIRSELATQPDFIRRFEAEAHLVARIEHPHIVPLIDFWRDPDSAYLVMRWLRGGTLERQLDDGPLSLENTSLLARQMCGALSTAHRHGVVHRDVKSGNIMFDEEGNAFLTDFGIALEAQQSSGPEAALSTGSPAYSSPEQLRRELLGPQADIFSLGVVLFECLAGSLPFADSSSVAELIDRQLTTAYPPLHELREDIPRRFSDAIARATAKDAADRFASMDEFLVALEGDQPVRGAKDQQEHIAVAPDVENPYKGLRAFDDGDVDDFFGRNILVDSLIERLAGTGVASRCLVVVGPSGSGKSSVVRAGLVPALRSDAVANSRNWFATTMVPGTDPYEALEVALLRVAVNPPVALLSQLRDGQRGILRCIRRCLSNDDETALVVIDQFEEIFTNSSNEVANNFLEALAVAVEDPTTQLRLVITLRADYFDRPLSHHRFANVINKAAVNVTPLAPDELEQAIVEPARRLGAEFEPGLVARIAAETIGQSSPLPLLQYTLSELFDRREGNELTIAAYDEIGGLAGALGARAEDVYTSADASRQHAIRRVFGRMTNPGEQSTDLRRRIPVSDLGEDPANLWVIEQFGNARLVTFDRDETTREPTVEVAHEALLREWPRLTRWLAEDAELLRSVGAVASAASVWDHGGRTATDLYRGGRLENAIGLVLAAPDRLREIDTDFIESSRVASERERDAEHRRVRRLRRLVTAVGAALVIALIAGGIAFQQRNDAQDATRRARLATLISTSAAVAADDDELAVLLALEAHRQAPGPATEQAVLNALGSSSLANRGSALDEPPGCQSAGTMLYLGAETQFVSREDALLSRDTLTGELTEHGPPPSPCVSWVGNATADRRVAWAGDDVRMWFASWDGPWVMREFTEPRNVVDSMSFNATQRLMLFAIRPNTPDAVFLVDDVTGESVGDPITASGDFVGGTMSPSGAHAVASFELSGGHGILVVLDGETGAELFRVESSSARTEFVFDDQANELVVGAADGTLTTIDLATGESIAQVGTDATSNLIDLGLRSDGLLVAVSNDLVEILDRTRGPRGDSTTISSTSFARLRPDGWLFAANTAQTGFHTLVLGPSVLTDTIIELDGAPNVVFQEREAGGLALSIGARGTGMELIDLSTGDREELPALNTPEGDPFVAEYAEVEENGLLAVSADGVVARWEDGVMVERITTGPERETGLQGYASSEGRLIMSLRVPDASFEVHFINTDPGELKILTTVTGQIAGAYVTRDEFALLGPDGIVRTYDQTGANVGQLDIGLAGNGNGWDEDISDSGGLVAFGGSAGVVILNPTTEQLTRVPTSGPVSTVLFARGGTLLLTGDRDGVVRLWDVREGVSRGVFLRTGEPIDHSSWYDEDTDSLWIRSGTRLLKLPLNPAVFLERACEILNRDLTQQEWDTYVKLGGQVQSACG
jgi:serine/threonine protein kinase/DNA-binding winged helix-turn-helix (wHTH) protein